jgi:hypothetical protein
MMATSFVKARPMFGALRQRKTRKDEPPALAVDATAHAGIRIETEVLPIPAPTHPTTIALQAFWESRHDGRHLLNRADLPCREAAALLPHIFVLERADADGNDWRLRLVGTELTGWLGFDPTGQTISSLYHPSCIDHNARVYRMVTMLRSPHVTQGRIGGVNRDFLKLEIVHLPMEGTSPGNMMLLGGIAIFDPPL